MTHTYNDARTRANPWSDEDSWEDLPESLNIDDPRAPGRRPNSPSGSVASSTRTYGTPRKRRPRQRLAPLAAARRQNYPPSPRPHPSSTNTVQVLPGRHDHEHTVIAEPAPLTALPVATPDLTPINATPAPEPPLYVPPSATSPSSTVTKDEVRELFWTFAVAAFRYTADVCGTAVRLLKQPIAILLFIWLLGFLLARISNTIRSSLAPLCYIPGVSRLCVVPIAQNTAPVAQRGTGQPAWADYPRLMNVERQTFETLLEETVDSAGLALEIKKAEMATSDLATLVRVSDLTSRDMLAEMLSEFVKDARKAGRGLQQFSSKVGSAVDSIISVNDYALHTIEAANSKLKALSLRRIWPFSVDEAATKEVVTQMFTEAMNSLSANMQRLVLEAEISLADLDRLEERLGNLHELVSREDSTLAISKSELLSNLWTILGGNRKTLHGMDTNLALLRNVGGYRKRALAHVVAALQTLQGMSVDMEELRQRVAAPELVGERIPVEVHMKSIRTGLDRLQERRIRAREREEDIVSRVMGVDSSRYESLD
ncbi:hypothetical protein BV25DRAFT_1896972 [Artomyces pyxidatus]|uniref:Uncharacterized protein n=1 Tax=Artomyces pyxidatus TaxID=48021 RepID=A0ACB8TFV8_9AGAM|nr:hypothetical protein BV25DRAFT_1896972 [Artomyces pyxidatus]